MIFHPGIALGSCLPALRHLKFIALACILTGLYSCSKNSTPQQKPAQPAGGTVVLVAGGDGNVAKLWTNGMAISLTDGKQPAALASVYSTGTDVYTAGFEGNFAKVWKNGVPTSLTSGKYSAVANSVYVSGNDVYAAGHDGSSTLNTIATVWKNGTPFALTKGDKEADASGVFVSGSDVYVSGYEGTNAKLWKNGIDQNLSTSDYASEANSVFVSGNDVYVAGEHLNAAGNEVATLWKNGVASAITDGSRTALANSVFVWGIDVYIGGSEASANAVGPSKVYNSIAKVWKNEPGVLTATYYTDGSVASSVSSVFFSGGTVYAAGGQETTGSNTLAEIWKNGTVTTLSSGNSMAGAASIFVVSGEIK